jgi:competence protein ComEA
VQKFFEDNQKLIIFFLLGLILIGFGVLSFKSNIFSSGDKVEVLETAKSSPENSQDLVVEIVGSVEKPGVYKLPFGSRVDDLLIIAGGLSITADREWVTKNINRASKLLDGQKIYVFSQSEVTSAKKTGSSLDDKVLSETIGTSGSGLININTADQKTLESLVGIGPVYAQKMIEGRSYSNIEELVSKKIIPQKTFDKIKNEISVY